jgi:tetratricopeptide (TPR) repeat protein
MTVLFRTAMHRLLPVLALLCLTPLCARAASNFTATLDRDSISLGETVTLSLTFEGGNPRNQPTAPSIPDVEYGSTGTSQQIQIVNGQPTVRSTYTFEIKPLKVGEFTIPAIQSDIDGRPVTSQPLKLKVEKTAGLAHPAGTAEPAFVRVVVPKKEFYVGEVVPIELQCYVQDHYARQVDKPVLASEGFIIGDVPNYDHQPPRVTIGSGVYYLLTFRVPVRATRTGPLTLGPASWTVQAVTGSDFFGFQQVRPATVQSDTASVTILPVPTKDAPPSFTGAIGNFTLSQYQAGPTNVSAGDPVTLKIRIAGQGSWDTVTISSSPTGAEWREFKLYPATSKLETRDQMQIDGSKYFEQVITPENADVKEIPGFAFSFFDPNARAFRTVQHAPLPLVVKPTAATPQPTIVQTSPPSTDQQQANTQEIVNIKVRLGNVSRGKHLLIQQPAFIAVQAIPALAFVFAFAWRQRKENLANNPRLLRQREVARKIETGLAELSQHAQSNNTAEFYATVFRLLQEQIGERLDLPASGITESVVTDLPLSTEDSARVQELFQLCNQYRYARQQTSAELQSVIEKLKAALATIGNIDTAAKSSRSAAPIVTAIAFLLSVIGANAQDLESLFSQANRLYEQGKFAEAAKAYDNMLQVGVVSPSLYFNAGNAWFKSGQIGRAIVEYRKAEKLSPRDPDIRANLQFARNQIANYIPALPGTRFTRWMNRLSVNEWTVAASASLALLFIVLTIQQLSPNLRKPLRTPALILALATICLAICLYVDFSDAQTKAGVITTSEAVIRRGPFDESQSAFTVRDGAELLIVDAKDNWLQVADATHRTGWIKNNQLSVIE